MNSGSSSSSDAREQCDDMPEGRAVVGASRDPPGLERLADTPSRLRRYQELFALAPVGYIVVDAGARIVKINRVAEELLPVTGDRLLGRRFGVLFGNRDRARLRRFLTGLLLDPTLGIREIVLALRGQTDSRVRLQVRADEARERALIVLTSARELGVGPDEMDIAVSVYRVLDQAVMIADADNRIVSVNPRFTEITGYAREEVLTRESNLLKSGRQDRAFYQRMWEALETRGQWHGELWNRRKDGREFLESLSIHTLVDHEGKVVRRVALFSDITDQRRVVEEAQRQANYDVLTGLPNRNLLLDRLDHEIRKAQRSGRNVALLYLDLDHFKEVNDTLGHQAGDQLLQEAGGRIRACVRETDTVARIGGDEFTVLMTDLADLNRVDTAAQHIVETLAEPFRIGPEVVQVSASIGIAVFPEDANGLPELLDHADRAMYAAKKAGRNRCHYFTPQLQSTLQERKRRIAELREALAGQQFRVYLQPVVDIATGNARLVEALLRWQHPERGIILPGQFLPLAQEIGIMGDIGDLVFDEVAAVVARLPPIAGRDWMRVTINQSLRELCYGRAGLDWSDYLRRFHLPLERVLFEVTEQTLLDGGEMIESVMRKQVEQGIAIALDDYGAGQASMTCLQRIHFDYVKIDGSVIRRIPTEAHARAFLDAAVMLTRSLSMPVIAEGVETEAQLQGVRAAGCAFAQGFLLGPPVPAPQYLRV